MKKIILFISLFAFLLASENIYAQYYASEQKKIADDFLNKMRDKESSFKIQTEEMIELNKTVTSKFVDTINNLAESCKKKKGLTKLSNLQITSLTELQKSINSIPNFDNLSDRNMKNKIDAGTERVNRYCPAPEGDLEAYINCVDKTNRAKMILLIGKESIGLRLSLYKASDAAASFFNCALEKKSVDYDDIENVNSYLNKFINLVKSRDESIQNTALKLLD